MSNLPLYCLLALTFLCGCATNTLTPFKNGDYRLISLSENARPVDITVVLKLSDSSLAIAGTQNSWIAPISNNKIGALTSIKRSDSRNVGAFEGMFLNTIEGAEIITRPDGLVTFNRQKRIVAIFEPIE